MSKNDERGNEENYTLWSSMTTALYLVRVLLGQLDQEGFSDICMTEARSTYKNKMFWKELIAYFNATSKRRPHFQTNKCSWNEQKCAGEG
jgi:hypothetical protein